MFADRYKSNPQTTYRTDMESIKKKNNIDVSSLIFQDRSQKNFYIPIIREIVSAPCF